MIHIDLQKEPVLFDVEVRQRGMKWLQKKNVNLNKTLPFSTKDLPSYWSRHYHSNQKSSCLDEMRNIYRFCAYTNILIHPKAGTVDHFLSKKNYPSKIYEWSNYRLALLSVNRNKSDFDDVLDPFKIKNGWFQLNVGTGIVYADPLQTKYVRAKIEKTIARLKLNDFVSYRLKYIDDYINGDISLSLLKRDAPFIYYELKRQNML